MEGVLYEGIYEQKPREECTNLAGLSRVSPVKGLHEDREKETLFGTNVSIRIHFQQKCID